MIQEQVLNKILSTGDSSIITLNNLNVEYFSDYTEEFNFIKRHLDQYSSVPDRETFLSRFPDFDVIEVSEPNTYLLDELSKDKAGRFLVANLNKMRQSLMNGNIEEAVNLYSKGNTDLSSLKVLQATNIFDDTSRFESYEDKTQNNSKYFIKTGFRELDNLVCGWNRKEDLVTIVARNGIGKSWVLFKCASAAAKAGYRVGIYSGEMSTDSVGYRIDTFLGHISNGALVHGGPSVKNQYENYLQKLKEEATGELWVLTPKDIGSYAKPSTLTAFVEKYNLDILFVDQYSLMLDDQGADNDRVRLSNISIGLKLLQTTHQIPIITVAQQNREKLEGEKAFDTTQIMGCDMIGQNSSIVLFLGRKDDLMKIYLGKLRENAGVGTFLDYRIDLNLGNWEYVPGEGNEAISDSEESMSGYTEDEVF